MVTTIRVDGKFFVYDYWCWPHWLAWPNIWFPIENYGCSLEKQQTSHRHMMSTYVQLSKLVYQTQNTFRKQMDILSMATTKSSKREKIFVQSNMKRTLWFLREFVSVVQFKFQLDWCAFFLVLWLFSFISIVLGAVCTTKWPRIYARRMTVILVLRFYFYFIVEPVVRLPHSVRFYMQKCKRMCCFIYENLSCEFPTEYSWLSCTHLFLFLEFKFEAAASSLCTAQNNPMFYSECRLSERVYLEIRLYKPYNCIHYSYCAPIPSFSLSLAHAHVLFPFQTIN